ncbi:hypothetical protein EXIGLDRAFT_792766 [Exidia glandulosa HHB12029]|uniref:DnaJ homologue subfamily C member 28 conserved domain-containing protein n=1 Tax=Exidia glandulosa HHB12029 TaxID=1314781 RepID=A0A165GXV7_EXIGL|nr:hypothetical protein EXIGLDRAFT_792766 [Exidia glandulosa HHB12029]
MPVSREQRKRMREAGRLTNARDASLDYRLRMPSERPRANPVTLRGWGSLVDERIERARAEGHFRSLRGRGKPLERETAEGNPFIAREQFLMNRIIQRNGAAPPWVEVQGELEDAVSSFRDVLQASWVRKAVRSLSASHPRQLLCSVTRDEIAALRDPAWETRERSFHDAALDDVNRVVRKHNAIAPIPVRKGYLTRDVELARCYRVSVDAILEELQRRAHGSPKNLSDACEGFGQSGEGADAGPDVGLAAMFRAMVRGVVERFIRPL